MNRSMVTRPVLLIAVVGAALAGCAPRGGPPVVPTPATVTGPVTAGEGMPFQGMSKTFLDRHGYVEEEFFFEGTANSYQAQGALNASGRWTVKPRDSAKYKTRMLVQRPEDPARFSGNVVVEWYNVSGGHDFAPEFAWTNAEVLRAGHAYVAVSAQKVGVEPGGTGLGVGVGSTGKPVKVFDPARYGSLAHPGDDYSFDIFTQAGAALKAPNGADPLGGVRPKKVIAAGESQSAFRLAAYVNGVQPLAKTYDGFLIHSRGASISGFGGWGTGPMHIRTDLDAPVLQVLTETELGGGFAAARQPDTTKVRTWEIAGAAHIDRSVVGQTGVYADPTDEATSQNVLRLCGSINDSQQKYALRRGVSDLFTWSSTGRPPASGAPLEVSGSTIARDALGNAKGGVRTPALDVPIARHNGLESHGTGAAALSCALMGWTEPFDRTTLQTLYPTHADYVAKVTGAADKGVTDGFILPADRDEIIRQAEAAPIPQ